MDSGPGRQGPGLKPHRGDTKLGLPPGAAPPALAHRDSAHTPDGLAALAHRSLGSSAPFPHPRPWCPCGPAHARTRLLMPCAHTRVSILAPRPPHAPPVRSHAPSRPSLRPLSHQWTGSRRPLVDSRGLAVTAHPDWWQGTPGPAQGMGCGKQTSGAWQTGPKGVPRRPGSA